MSDTNAQATLDTNTPELRLNRLEAAWRGGDSTPDWRQHLPSDEESCSPQLILDLVQMDIEYRIKAGLPALLSERYFEHPRLQRDDARLDDTQQVELIQWEYLQRLNRGERPRRAEYEAAFPRHIDALREMKPRSRCPSCQKVLILEETLQTLLCPDCGVESHLLAAAPRSVRGATLPAELDVRSYQLIETLGRGGMGEVYRCGDPALGRDLAIKVMMTEYRDHAEAERRFLREARVTGSLQHPSIVPVHNLGRLADGRLHYTMRLVRGETFAAILEYEAGKAERLPYLLSIFEKICQAVAYAHSKRVIHRDLKPHNVMVGRFGEVQVMDWGLAKLLTAEEASPQEEAADAADTRIPAELADTPVDLTRTGSALGTLAYMPPEQALGEKDRIDERADVFALGSILCKILTGQPAYSGADGNEIYRRVKRGNVTEALERLQQCGADGPLIALCGECLNPDQEDRPRDADVVAKRVAEYQAAVQERLRQAELERVAAQTRAQEERKRRRWTIQWAAALGLVLLAGAVISIWQAVRATTAESKARDNEGQALALAETNENLAKEKANLADKERNAREIAEAEAEKARTVATFLKGIFEASDPLGLTSNSLILYRQAGENPSVRDVLKRGKERCDKELGHQPKLKAAVLAAIGDAYISLAEYKKAEPLLKEALELRQQQQENPLDIAASLHSLGTLHHALGEYEPAEQEYEQALGLRQQAQPPEPSLCADTLFYLGWLQWEKDELEKSLNSFQDCLARRRACYGEEHRLVALAKAGLAGVLLEQEKYLQAALLSSQAMKVFRQLEGSETIARAIGLFQDGIVLLRENEQMPLLGRFTNAQKKGEENLIESLRLAKKALGTKHLYVAFVAGIVAKELSNRRDDIRAERYFQECLEISKGCVGLWHPKADRLIVEYALLLNRLKKEKEARKLCDDFLAAREEHFQRNPILIANALATYVVVVNGYKLDPQSKGLCERAIEIFRNNQPLKGTRTIQGYELCLIYLALIHQKNENLVAAEELLWKCLDSRQRSQPNHWRTFNAKSLLGEALLRQKKFDKAESLLVDGYEGMKQREATIPPQGKFRLTEALERLVQLYEATDQKKKAADWRKKLEETKSAQKKARL